MGAKRDFKVSDEERARRSELAKQLHSKVVDPTTGRRAFGGRQPGAGRPRRVRAAELVAEEAKKSATEIVSALKDALDAGNPASIRVNAAKTWLEIENREADLQLKEDRDFATLSDEELAMRVAEGFMRLSSSGAFDEVLSASVDDEVIVEGGMVVDE